MSFMTCSLAIFIDENGGEEYTTISGLKIYGTPLDTVNVAAIHEQKHEQQHERHHGQQHKMQRQASCSPLPESVHIMVAS